MKAIWSLRNDNINRTLETANKHSPINSGVNFIFYSAVEIKEFCGIF